MKLLKGLHGLYNVYKKCTYDVFLEMNTQCAYERTDDERRGRGSGGI